MMTGMNASPLNSRDLSVIIPASSEAATMASVLQEVEQLRPREIIVVVNGSRDETAHIVAERHHRLVEFSERLGHDVGRSIGAFLATGSVLLFVDADIVIPWTELEPFVRAIESGFDVALNDIDTIVSKYPWDPVSVQKIWLNVCLGRRHLETASLTAVPHALSRTVFRYITPDDLSVPPKAYAKLVTANAQITKAHIVDVVTTNKIHGWHGVDSGHDLMADLIVGDHLEALDWLRITPTVVAGEHSDAPESAVTSPLQPAKSPPRASAGRQIRRALYLAWRWLIGE